MQVYAFMYLYDPVHGHNDADDKRNAGRYGIYHEDVQKSFFVGNSAVSQKCYDRAVMGHGIQNT
jgi:hypothetical protein